MIDPLQAMLQQVGLKTAAFPPSSRYYGIETVTLERPGSNPVSYIRRRFVPAADQFSLLQEHTVTQGERPDHIAYQYLGDPEKFWQLCDANNVVDPDELTREAGEKIRITLPQGIPGTHA
ncbi:MAG: LysM domain-containing protein [Williamsia sp.]|nr:LysM domain-containing protein [Williamsia sp.]